MKASELFDPDLIDKPWYELDGAEERQLFNMSGEEVQNTLREIRKMELGGMFPAGYTTAVEISVKRRRRQLAAKYN